MCEFPSWIETDEGEIVFLKDKDIKAYMEGNPMKSQDWRDYIGHNVIRILTGKKGRECEGTSLPYEIQLAILKGKLTRMYKAAGFDKVFLRGMHEVLEGKILCLGWSMITAWENSQVDAYENSQVTAYENSQVTAYGNSQVHIMDNAKLIDQRKEE